jgi:3-hydroxyacyl-[acyl-carrier-protein] dehydratase
MRFLLVDRITAVTADGIRGVKNVTMSEDVLEHHFPGRPVMPGVLLLEALAQLAGWLEASSSDFERWLLVDRVNRCGFYSFALPGDQVELEVTPVGPAADGRRAYRGVGRVEGSKRVAAELEGLLVPLADLEDPAAQRRAFTALTRMGSW